MGFSAFAARQHMLLDCLSLERPFAHERRLIMTGDERCDVATSTDDYQRAGLSPPPLMGV